MIERKIIINLITSTDFCRRISSIWDVKLLASATAKKIAMWCWEYYLKYNEAPGRNIEDIFYKKSKQANFPKDVAEEIEQDILPGLSEEYENESFNIEFAVQETEKYFAERHLTIHHESLESLIAAGETEQAEKLALEFHPLSISSNDIDKHIRSVQKIREIKRPRPPLFLSPWLRAGQGTIIYGNFGSGKSLLTLAISYVLGMRNYDSEDAEINEWQVKQPIGTLYIDGEIGEQEMEERVKKFEWLGKQDVRYRLKILSIPEYQIETEDQFYLSVRVNQLKIIKWLKEHENYKLIVLDSASTLFGLEEENDNSEWNKKINPFLRDLRALGVAWLLLHHSGKQIKRGLRGASAMGAMPHNIYKLEDHPDKDIDKGEAWFNLTKDKQRSGGFSFKAFGLKFYQTEEGEETHWKVTPMC